MENSSEIKNIKTEPINTLSIDEWKIRIKRQMDSVNKSSSENKHFAKRQDIYSINTELHIKNEPQEDESDLNVIAGIFHEICPSFGIKVGTTKQMVKIKCEDLVGEIMQDPLDVCSEIKVAVKNEHLLSITSDENRSKQKKHLLVGNKQICRNKKHICYVCNKLFTKKSNLNVHFRVHSMTKPFTCELCKNSFSLKCNLDRHMLIHSGEKPYVCDTCKKVFRDISTLNNHKLTHSGVKPFSCEKCDKSFARKVQLVVHEHVHTGYKPFTCDLCNTTFTQKSNLNVHRRLHTGEKPYSCDICNISFTQKSNLKKHKKIHSK